MMIFVKIPRIIFMALHFGFMIFLIIMFYFFLLTVSELNYILNFVK
jgi:hypothetical protein